MGHKTQPNAVNIEKGLGWENKDVRETSEGNGDSGQNLPNICINVFKFTHTHTHTHTHTQTYVCVYVFIYTYM